MSDLIERLEDEATSLSSRAFDSQAAGLSANLAREAADRIEALEREIDRQMDRAESASARIDELEAAAQKDGAALEAKDAEITTLRANRDAIAHGEKAALGLLGQANSRIEALEAALPELRLTLLAHGAMASVAKIDALLSNTGGDKS